MVRLFPSTVFLYVWRTVWILLCTLVFAVAFPLPFLLRSSRAPGLLRWYLQASGGGFVKLGQILSMRYDLLPGPYQRELGKLLDRMPQIGFARVRKIIERDLGRPLNACFARVEERAVGAASVAQVHAAELLTGERVVIKVLRPGVQHQFAIDFFNLGLITRLIDFLGLLAPIDLTGLVREAARLVDQEFDFRREARNMQVLYDLMETDEIAHRAPRVFFEFSGARIITMERFEGVWVKDLLAAIHANDQKQLALWREQGVDPTRVARILFRSIMEQCYRHRVFHADPHAGNLIVMADGSVGFIDFGMVGVLDERLWAQQFRIFEVLSSGGIHAAYEALLATIEPLENHDLSTFETEVKGLLSDWLITAQATHSTGQEKSASRMLLQLGDAMRRSGLGLPWNVLRLYRVQIVADMIVYTLFPQLNPIQELKYFFVDERRRRQQLLLSAKQEDGSAPDLLGILDSARKAAVEVIQWVRFTLPHVGRQYLREATRLELAVALTVHYFRLCTLGLACGAALGTWAIGHGLWKSASPGLTDLLVNWGWVIAGISGIMALVFGRIHRRLLDPA